MRGGERNLRETGDRNRNYNSYNRGSADIRRINYDSRTRSPTPGGENRSRDWSHESRANQSQGSSEF